MALASVTALAVAGIGLGATRANAVVTGTAISGSSYPATFTLIAGSRAAAAQNAPALTLAGVYARSGSSADGIDSQCYSGTTRTLIGTQTSPANGAFQVAGRAPVGAICDLRAVPSGTVPTGSALATYPALRQAFDYAGTADETVTTAPSATPTTAPSATPTTAPSKVPTVASASPSGSSTAPSVNVGIPVHLQAGLPQAAATVGLGDAVATGSAPSGGVTTGLLDGSLDAGATSVFSAAGLLPSDGATTSKRQTQQGGIRVDGVNVLTPGAAADIWGTDGDQPSFNGRITATASINGQTGDATVTTSEPLLVCPDPSLPATKTTCPSFTTIGVTLNRTTTTTQGGRVVRVTDSFTSDAAHSIALDYEHTVTSTSTGARDVGPEFSIDGGATYSTAAQGTGIGLPTAPFSLLVKTSGDPTSFAHPAGSVTYSTQPTSAVFANGGNTLVTHYDRQIPAGGSFTLTHSYVSGDTDASVSSLSTFALDNGLAPSISIAVPASVSAQNTVISGVVTPGQNGLPFTVAGPMGATANVDQRTGIFAVPAVLKPGPQTVTITAVDIVGQAVTQTATVSYDNPLSVGRLDDYVVFSSHLVVGKKLIGKRIVAVKVRVRYVSGIRLLVPLHCSSLATTVCTAKIKVSSHGKVLKTVLFTRGPGYRPIVTIPLAASAYGSAGYDAAHSPKPTKQKPHPAAGLWSVGVNVSYTDPNGSSYPGFTSGSIRI